MIEGGRQHPFGRRPRGGRFIPPLLATAALLTAVLGGGMATGAVDRVGSYVEADRVIDRIIGGERITYMYGNVFIDRDTVTAAADTAIVYREREKYEFHGNVRMNNQGSVLTCQWGTYLRLLGVGDYYGDVRVIDGEIIGTGRKAESRRGGNDLRLLGSALLITPEYSVRGDTIFRERDTGRGEAFGNVSIMEPGSENLVTGDHAIFLADTDVAEVDRNPELTSRQQEGGALVSTAGLMRFFRLEDRVVMTDSVRIRQGRMRAWADTAVALGRERLVLTGAPVVEQDGSVMRGDEIEFYYVNGLLHRAILTGSAVMEDTSPDSLAGLYRGLPSMDVLQGDSISIEFEEGEIRRSVVVGHARSRYTPLDLDDEIATNDVSGDTIVLHFRRKVVQRVDVRGNVSGIYRFASLQDMEELLGRSRRLADLMAASPGDSAAMDSLGATAVAHLDSQRLAQVDSLAREMGLVLPAPAPDRPQLVDSLLTVALDSLAGAGLDTSRSDLDFLASAQDVVYGGRSLAFGMADRKIDIGGDGELEYGSMVLTAQRIKLDTDKRELYAEGDPLVVDSETIAGDRMGYNFEHRTGAVSGGVTSFDDYYYVGDEINRYKDTTLKICSARMTSCDLENPHYHFWSDKMKMRMEDKVVAAPVVMHVGHVPVFALPFYYKSLKQGRQSGILFPNFDFGWSSREGRYIRDFGYYWATNDYMDVMFEADYNERQDFGWRIRQVYNKRYSFGGNVNYSRKVSLGSSVKASEWRLTAAHSQPKLFDDYRFTAKVELASNSLSSDDLAGSNDRHVVSGQQTTDVGISRAWSWGNASLSASRREYTNAATDDPASTELLSTMTLPSFSIGFRDITLLPQKRGGGGGSFLGNLGRNTRFKHNYSSRLDERENELVTTRQYNAQGDWSLTVAPDRIGIFNLKTSASASQAWSRIDSTGNRFVADTDSTFHYDTVKSTVEDTRPSVRFSAGVNSTLYGLLPVNLGKVRTIRHTLTMGATWRLSPALPGHQLHSTSYGFSLGNRFDVKYVTAGEDSTLTEKKLDGLLDWGLSSSYNPDLPDGNRWADIGSNVVIKPGKARYLQLKVSNTIDPESLSLKSTRFSYGLSFTGRLGLGDVAPPPEDERNTAIDRLGLPAEAPADTLDNLDDPFLDDFDREDGIYGVDDRQNEFYDRTNRHQGGRDTKDPTEGGRIIPFNINTSMTYSYRNAFETRSASKTASANVSVSANLTRNWDFSYRTSFNLVSDEIVQQQYSLNRDLHCWRLEFTRTVSTIDSSFGFRLYLRSIPDLKFARGRDTYSSAPGAGLGGF